MMIEAPDKDHPPGTGSSQWLHHQPCLTGVETEAQNFGWPGLPWYTAIRCGCPAPTGFHCAWEGWGILCSI